MQKYDDPRFGAVDVPQEMSELLELCGGSLDECDPVRMWRGQSDESWLIHSGAYRRLALRTGSASERGVASYEKRLLENATHRGFRWHEGRELSDFELLARLQHHGAATRLIDTTRNAMVGLYFACITNPEKNGLLFGIHCDGLGGGERSLITKNYAETISLIKDFNHPQTWEPPSVSKRVSAQHSQFVYSKIVTDRKSGSLALDEEPDSLKSIKILSSLKSQYLTFIERVFDIHVESIFPDLDGFGMSHSHSRDEFASYRW